MLTHVDLDDRRVPEQLGGRRRRPEIVERDREPLIDQLGDEKTAIAWLVSQKGVKADLPVRDYKLSPRFGDLTFLRSAAAVTLDALGLGAIARQIEQSGMAQAVDRFGLDGMLALWHPVGAN